VYELLKEGKVSLCALSEVAKVITPENKREILNLSQGLPKQEAQKLAAQYQPATLPKRETIRAKKVVVAPITATVEVNQGNLLTPGEDTIPPSTSPVAVEERFSLSLEVDAECMELINDAKRYSGKVKLSDLMKVVLKDYVNRKKPKVVTATPVTATPVAKTETWRNKTEESRVLKPSRYISRKVKDEVRVRDGERCTYVSPEGRRCGEMGGLQFDHTIPFAHGGESSRENLRLKCSAHNLLYAEEVFGREFMDQKRRRI
jgi:5-methylcytosine-specific restriction endonuclease McrA